MTAGANPFWGSSLATAAVRAVDMLSELAASSANLVKESRNVAYKQNIEVAGVGYPRDLPKIINMHDLTIIHSHFYVTRTLPSTLCSTEVITLAWPGHEMNAFKNRESYKYTLQLDGFVICERGEWQSRKW